MYIATSFKLRFPWSVREQVEHGGSEKKGSLTMLTQIPKRDRLANEWHPKVGTRVPTYDAAARRRAKDSAMLCSMGDLGLAMLRSASRASAKFACLSERNAESMSKRSKTSL